MAGGFVTPGTPNLSDFLTFLATSVQIPAAALPADSPWPGYALDQAIDLVITPGGTGPSGGGILYTLACYNGATHILMAITPDQTGQTFFADSRARSGFGLITPSTGLVVGSSDESTSATLAQPAWAAGLTVGQLEFFKTPWGRSYLSWQQSYGPTIVGLT